MYQDPIVEELRKIRQQIEQECQNDADLYYAHLLEQQKPHTARLVCRAPKPLLTCSSLNSKRTSDEKNLPS
jgi:hypothetical protein